MVTMHKEICDTELVPVIMEAGEFSLQGGQLTETLDR